MNKKIFLDELSKGISKLPNKERKVLIDFYSELIDDKIEGGQSESDVVSSFGSVNVLSERLLIENPNRKKSGCLYWVIGAVLIIIIVFMGLMLNFSNFSYEEDSVVIKTLPANENNAIASTKDGFIVLNYEYKDIDEISLDAAVSEIIVEKSSDTNIFIRYKEYKDEMNTVELKGRKLEFDNELQTNTPAQKGEHKIYLTIPEEYKGSLDINADLGAIKMVDFNLSKIDLSAGLGTIEIENCTAVDIDLSSGMGAVSIKNTIAEHNLEASSDMGTVEVFDIDGQNIELSTDMGAIKGKILGKQDEYTILNDIGMGKSNISNQAGGSKNLNVSTSMGSINLIFSK